MLEAIHPGKRRPLHGNRATRRIEHTAQTVLPAHTLMQRAGLAVARLGLALAPHARTIWIACGPGNNGGDGLEAAAHLLCWGLDPVVTWLGDPERAPTDARASWERARAAGVRFADSPPELGPDDLAIDALLGIGAARTPQGRMAEWLDRMQQGPAPILAIDLPTGLSADTGWHQAPPDLGPVSRHTLSLLTLKPGLFTAHGRDAAGQIWFDDLGVDALLAETDPPTAWLNPAPARKQRLHTSHKGSFGDVAVIGGQTVGATSMIGAALLAARAALHAGAGRVFVCPLGENTPAFDPAQPELMFRRPETLVLRTLTVACGCGGGEAVRAYLPEVLARVPRLVLDADALNAIAADPTLQEALRRRVTRAWATILTPHPLEAARLLGTSTDSVQQNRLAAATMLAERLACTIVLKGSGTIIAAPKQTPVINPTGNARLATPGTGDVLAGSIAAHIASGAEAFSAAKTAVFHHGLTADQWLSENRLNASILAKRQ